MASNGSEMKTTFRNHTARDRFSERICLSLEKIDSELYNPVGRARRYPYKASFLFCVLFVMIAVPRATAWTGNSWTWHRLSAKSATIPPNFLGKTIQQPNIFTKWSMALDSRELRFYGGSLLHDIHQGTCTARTPTMVGVSSTSSVDLSFSLKQTIFSRFGSSQCPSPKMQGSNVGRVSLPRQGYGQSIQLTEEERKLFDLLRHVREETNLSTTLRVAGGWVRDKLLATPEFQAYHKVFDVGGKRLTSKFQKPAPSLGRQGTKILVSSDDKSNAPVDIDVALDDMLGREFADHLNDYLSSHGENTVSVGVVLKNPEKSKHLETATMKIESFWIDFVNLRAEEYTQNSRIPDLMRIGTAEEDAFRRDLTINALFYNINTGQVEDWTGRGFDDLRKGIVATPLAPLTTLLDDPLRVLRSVRFAARLRFNMDPELMQAAKDERVRTALAQKVSRERVGGEVDLMLRSPDPVGAMRLLINLRLADTVFPISDYMKLYNRDTSSVPALFANGLNLLCTAHDHLADCRLSPPLWCLYRNPIYDGGPRLLEDDDGRRFLWYAAFLKPLWDESVMLRMKHQDSVGARGKKANRSIITMLLVDDLKRPTRDAEAVEKIIKGSIEFSRLVNSGGDVSATMILLSDIRVTTQQHTTLDNTTPQREVLCTMNGRVVNSATEEDPVWVHAMELRQLCSEVLLKVGHLWRASLILAIAEQLVAVERDGLDYAIEGDIVQESQDELRRGVIERFDAFAAAMQQLGLIGIWKEAPLLDGQTVKKFLPRIPLGPAFREVMDEQSSWMIAHPGASAEALKTHMLEVFADYAALPGNDACQQTSSSKNVSKTRKREETKSM